MLPLNYICLQRPKNTGDVPRSAQSSAERERERGGRREGRPVGGVDRRWRKRGKDERQEEDSRSVSELGKRRAKPFSISQRDCMGRRAAELRCLLSSSGFYHRWGILAGREKERPHGYLRLQGPLRVTPCSSFISRPDREERESERLFKRQFDLRSTQERNLKEDLRKQLKGEYKGRTVTDAGQ